MSGDLSFIARYKVVRGRLGNVAGTRCGGQPKGATREPSSEAAPATVGPAGDQSFCRARDALAAMPMAVARRIQQDVCTKSGVRLDDLLGASRKLPVARARQLAMWRIRRETTLTLPAIGRLFNRDHTTVLWAIRKLEPDRLRAAVAGCTQTVARSGALSDDTKRRLPSSGERRGD